MLLETKNMDFQTPVEQNSKQKNKKKRKPPKRPQKSFTDKTENCIRAYRVYADRDKLKNQTLKTNDRSTEYSPGF